MRRSQSWPLLYLLPMLLALLPLVAGLQRLSRSRTLEQYIFSRRQAYWRVHLDRCSLSGPYATMTDRLLLDDAFRSDFAQKRVYLIGGCAMEEVLNTWRLRDHRPELGIYGMPGYNFVDLKLLVQWFKDRLAFGRQFNRQNLVLVGLTVDLAEPPASPSPAQHFLASGLYDYDAAGIRLKPMEAPQRWYLLHRLRLAQFLNSLWRLRPHLIARAVPPGLAPEMDVSQVPEQLRALQDLLRLLKGTGATVEAVVTPNASWLETPARIQTRSAMVAICQAEGIRVHDLSKTVPDQEFLDQDHLTYEGQQATHRELMPVLGPFLGHGARPDRRQKRVGMGPVSISRL